MTDRRSFLGWLASVSTAVGRSGRRARSAPVLTVDARPTALFQQPDGHNNLVRITVTGLEAPAGRARVTDRRGTLVGTAGLLPTAPSPGAPAAFAGEVWIPLSGPAEFQIGLEVGKQRVGRRRVRLAPPRR